MKYETVCRKMDMVASYIKEICDVLEQESGYYYACPWFPVYKVLEQFALSSIGLPSIEEIKSMCKYAKDHYPDIELHDVIDYAAMIFTGEIELTDDSREVEAAIDTMVEYITCNAGYSFEEVLDTIKKGIV